MRHARLLIGLLLLATVQVDLVVASIVVSREFKPAASIVVSREFKPSVWQVVLAALAFAQASLVAIWAGFGRRSIAWRAMALVLAVALWSGLVAWTSDIPISNREMATEVSITLLASAVVVFASVLIARLTGACVVQATDHVSDQRRANGRPRWQFSLAYSFSWITAVAVMLGVLQCTFYREHVPANPEFWLAVGVLSITHTAMALAALWGVLGTRRPGLRIGALCLVTLPVFAAYYWLSDEFLAGAAFSLLQAFWLVASLWVFRVAGYRVVRQPSAAS